MKPEEQAAARRHYWVRLLAATEAAQDGGQNVGPIVQLHVVISTFLVLLNLKLIERLGRRKWKVRQGLSLEPKLTVFLQPCGVRAPAVVAVVVKNL